MEISVDRGPRFSWPVTDAAGAPRRIPLSHRSLRPLIVLALYGVTVLAIHRLAAEFASHPVATPSSTGMCHRH